MDAKVMQSHPEIIYELIISIINILSMFANVLLAVAILRSKTMRTRTNLYILNVVIADILTLLVLLVYYVDKRLIHYAQSLPTCVVSNLEIALQCVTMCFVLLLLVTRCASQGILVVLIWNVAVVAMYIDVIYCADVVTLAQGAICATLMTLLLFVLIGKSCQRCWRSTRAQQQHRDARDAAFRFNFATIFVCLCLTSWMVNIVAEFGFRSETIVKQFVLALGTSVKVGKNVALAFYLFKYNEMFKDSLMALFHCRSVRIHSHCIDYGADAVPVQAVCQRHDKWPPPRV